MSSDELKLITELFDNKFSVLLENLETIVENKVRTVVKDELNEVKQDIKIIKAAVTETNNDVRGLNQRVSILEAA